MTRLPPAILLFMHKCSAQLDSTGAELTVAKFAHGTVRLGALALLLAALPGCQNINANMPVSQVRIINASPDAPGLDIYHGGAGQSGVALAHNLGFGTVTSYVAITPGSSTIAANTAGSRQQIATSRGNFAESGQYTVLIGNVAGDLTQTILLDQSVAAPSGQISVRLLDQTTRFLAPMDVYFLPAGSTIAAASPTLTNVVSGMNSGYINLPAGTYTLVLVPAGTLPGAATVPVYTGAKVAYGSGVARTLILLDQQATSESRFQVITADDFDLAANTN